MPAETLNTTTSNNAAIISIGNELLSGKTVNTNAAYIANELAKIGLKTVRTLTVGDSTDEIRWAAKEACIGTQIVICTGGLGPTRDDISKKPIAEFFGRRIIIDEDQLAIVQSKFKALGYKKMPESNVTQAEVPEGSVILPNLRGTAPGLILNDLKVNFIMLPSVPVEMKGLMTDQVIPYLKKIIKDRDVVISRTIRTTGIGESKLAELLYPVIGEIEDPEIAYLPDPTGVDLRMTVVGKDETQMRSVIHDIEKRIIEIIPDNIFGFDNDSLESIVGSLLMKHGLTISVAESCTGGLVGDRITAVSGSSNYFDRAVVTYSDESKCDLLDVKKEHLKKFGAVSNEIARRMAENIKRKSRCDIGVSTTGIAGPTGETPEKPIGLVFLGLADKFGTLVKKLQLRGERSRIKKQSAQALLNLIRLRLNDKNLYSN